MEAVYQFSSGAMFVFRGKSAIGLAINYALNNEAALKRFLSDGKNEIDNNAAERAMRSIALGQKNWLFARSDLGGGTAAALYHH